MKLKKFYLFLLTLFVSSFISCKQNLDLTLFDDEDECCSVKISVENYFSSRTIAPDVLTILESEQSNYKFLLEYKNGRLSVTKEFSYAEFTNVQINDLKSGIYTFTLTLCKVEGENLIPLLCDVKSANIASKETIISFNLSPFGLEGSGAVNLKFNVHTADVELLGTGITLKVQLQEKNGDYLPEQEVTKETTSFVYARTEVLAGCYVLKVTINDGSSIFGYWQEDSFYVEPGRITTKEIDLPKLIYLPTSTVQSPVFNSEIETLSSNAIKFSWSEFINVQSYEIQIKEIEQTESEPLNESSWNSLIDSEADEFLEINQNNFIFESAEVGKNYVARIRAKNMCGYSAWIYLQAKIGREV